ncbi:hypothetical protein Dpep_0013 [Dethiosulfovibrio peptidovorans DSM 11002]|uniref:DUF2971 domain-containing protein n=2 Tax=Dethiosulfovibrio TaxID=47054 RepID=D2Z289_9BACT|nr:hypothetical protein Dpep_0013 [Dethiosulfovibrio peptidovorans DSM 11002]
MQEKFLVLSLTRNPLNSLMWSHYGQNHKGFVLGYDVSDAFFCSDLYNVITVNDGNVRYCNDREEYILNCETRQHVHAMYLISSGESIEDLMELPPKAPGYLDEDSSIRVKKMLSDFLLTKSSDWEYEDEVRVVRIVSDLFEECRETQSDPNCGFDSTSDIMLCPSMAYPIKPGLHMYAKKQEIKEVYLGCRNPILKAQGALVDGEEDVSHKAINEKWDVFSVDLDPSSWDVLPTKIDPKKLLVPKKTGLLNDITMTGEEATVLLGKLNKGDLSAEDTVTLRHFCVGGKEEISIRLNDEFVNMSDDSYLDFLP